MILCRSLIRLSLVIDMAIIGMCLPASMSAADVGKKIHPKRVGAAPAESLSKMPDLQDNQRAYSSANGKYTGIATYSRDSRGISEFKLLDDRGRVIWSRKDLPNGGAFYVSNVGNVVQLTGEYGTGLQFFGPDGRSAEKVSPGRPLFGRGFVWDESGKAFVVCLGARDGSYTTVFRPDGSKRYSGKNVDVEPLSVTVIDTRVFVVGQGKDAQVLLTHNLDGTEARKLSWEKGAILDGKRLDGRRVLIAPRHVVIMDAADKIETDFTLEDGDSIFQEAAVSPAGSHIVVTFRHTSSEHPTGFQILDGRGRALGRADLASKEMRFKFRGTSSVEVSTDKDLYEVDLE